MNYSNKPITNIINQLKRIKCFECGSYLVIKGLSSSSNELKLECNCKLFNYIFYSFYENFLSNPECFYITHSHLENDLISISKTYEVSIYENNLLTEEVITLLNKHTIKNEKELFEVINNVLQIYSKLQKNLIFI